MTINAQHPSTNSHFAKPNSPLKVREIFVEWRMENLQIVPALACKNVEAQYVEMKVPLYSYGCEKKIKKALSHLRGIYSVTVDYKLQKVTVWGICDRDDVLTTIKSKRKEACFWGCEEAHQGPRSGPKAPSRSWSWKALKKIIRSY
ncbi:uncharacterized protein LOC131232866 isoform X1 [Magnolia sinica]|uniref:uncharacterized protein LOC131232866 isoform X1 n=1 Tax=Magnolia sinica TaxID=86752 RepID=UPI002659C0FB|nr:uncharacterized protein LOC131232866 isoform X1 [Magnolia sinica]